MTSSMVMEAKFSSFSQKSTHASTVDLSRMGRRKEIGWWRKRGGGGALSRLPCLPPATHPQNKFVVAFTMSSRSTKPMNLVPSMTGQEVMLSRERSW